METSVGTRGAGRLKLDWDHGSFFSFGASSPLSKDPPLGTSPLRFLASAESCNEKSSRYRMSQPSLEYEAEQTSQATPCA